MFRKRKTEELQRIEAKAYTGRLPLVLLLDNIRSGHNVGSAFRSADAFGVEELALCGITARPPHREILKTALGATQSVRWQGFETSAEAVEFYKNKGYKIVAVEQLEPSTSLSDWLVQPDEPLVLIFGNEVNGLSDELLPLLDQGLEIPQFGSKHSFNVAVTLGIVLWAYSSQCR